MNASCNSNKCVVSCLWFFFDKDYLLLCESWLAEWALEGISVEVGIPTFALQFSIKQVSQKWSKIVQYGQYTGNFACFGAFIEKKD